MHLHVYTCCSDDPSVYGAETHNSRYIRSAFSTFMCAHLLLYTQMLTDIVSAWYIFKIKGASL